MTRRYSGRSTGRVRVGRGSLSQRSRLGTLFAVALACGAAAIVSTAAAADAREIPRQATAATFGVTPNAAIEPQVCSSCKPPLTYAGGPVLSTTGAGLTIIPIYWAPKGYAFPANYESIINGYITNIAAASGSNSNVFSIAAEYYEDLNGTKAPVVYRFHAGTPIVDTDAYPSNGCKPASGYTACITDDQLRTELGRITSSKGLATDLAHVYPVFYPPGVETKDRDGTTSAGDFCGYHRAFGSGADQTVYSDEPYETSSGCNAGQAPNGSVAADGTIDSFSHELTEAITDPTKPHFAWFDNQGNEAGDMCGNDYGSPLGSTNPSDPSHSEYNQVINGGKYYTQAEFSNVAYKDFGYGKGCALSEAQFPSAPATSTTSSTSSSNGASAASGAKRSSQVTTVITVVNDATPTTLPADGKSTSEVSLGVSNTAGNNVPNDPVHFSVGVRSGNGRCGTLSTSEKTTNSDGNADITYTASTSNVSCWVLAVEAHGGKPAEAVIYQGTTQNQSPRFNATYPTKVQAGGSADFTIKADNPTATPVLETRPHFVIFPGDGATKNVNASEVHLSYSTIGPNGTFTPVPLFGSTIKEGAIQGYVGPLDGTTLAPHSTTTYRFRVALASNVPVSQKGSLLAFEGYLDQINPADGTGATLADTYAYQVKVPSEASSNTTGTALIAIGAILVLAVGGGLIWHSARRQPPTSPPEPLPT